jgi:hypothetical protein
MRVPNVKFWNARQRGVEAGRAHRCIIKTTPLDFLFMLSKIIYKNIKSNLAVLEIFNF